ncbi:hypothetical protein KFK09_015996 [Dendrobium nobile]|uniref:Uncharacterized protein n=1 Tax=Dendrobium nobile TaxID=94219 RepID=A0A8T3B8F5_DENNO|nr:hypothetical protein KFK09_015996 [Dendrobium nobile]
MNHEPWNPPRLMGITLTHLGLLLSRTHQEIMQENENFIHQTSFHYKAKRP